MKKKIIVFAGSNSKESINQKLVCSISNLHEGIEVINLRDYQAPVYGVDMEQEVGFPELMTSLNKKLKEADGFIVSIPEHNGSMPAVFKNTIDWLSRIEPKVFNDKPTVFLSTSTGERGGASALEHVVAIMSRRGANVIGCHSQGNFQDHYSNGELSGELRSFLSPIIKKLYQAI
ncbi:MAG: NAD(P)H-dependent oxidoreductase [Crocinitomicaceae bacterium]